MKAHEPEHGAFRQEMQAKLLEAECKGTRRRIVHRSTGLAGEMLRCYLL